MYLCTGNYFSESPVHVFRPALYMYIGIILHGIKVFNYRRFFVNSTDGVVYRVRYVQSRYPAVSVYYTYLYGYIYIGINFILFRCRVRTPSFEFRTDSPPPNTVLQLQQYIIICSKTHSSGYLMRNN